VGRDLRAIEAQHRRIGSDGDADLQAWLRFYDFERPHRGYRLRGRPPAAVLYRHHPQALAAKGWDPDELIS
jgi:hypothetical protein